LIVIVKNRRAHFFTLAILSSHFSHQNAAQGTNREIKKKYKFKEPSGMLQIWRYIAEDRNLIT
jgi:hypothetical protein